MLGIVLTLVAVVLVIILAFYFSEDDSRTKERVAAMLIRSTARPAVKSKGPTQPPAS
jgi:predicted PurR-regulated permease PerM